MWSSILEKNSVGNGGAQKMEKLCGIVWTQNRGEIRRSRCDMGIKIKMCVAWSVSLQRKPICSATIFAKSTRIVWNGALLEIPFTQHCVEWGVNPR